jgi:hypothetical protein
VLEVMESLTQYLVLLLHTLAVAEAESMLQVHLVVQVALAVAEQV